MIREWIETLPQDFLDETLYRRFEKFFYAEINSQYTTYKPAGHVNDSFDMLNKFLKAHNKSLIAPVVVPVLNVRLLFFFFLARIIESYSLALFSSLAAPCAAFALHERHCRAAHDAGV